MIGQLPIEPGQRIGGRYRVEGALAQGGSSMVLLGTDLEGHRTVAIKVLLPEMAKTKSSRSRFERELRVLRHLRNEHVVKVLDDGALQTGEPFMVMEQLRGRTLKDVLREGPLRIEDAVDYMLQACEVLAEAHEAGVVHRDIKPENLFLVEEGPKLTQVKVIDFGLSKTQTAGPTRDTRELSITRGNEVMGSPYYMAPEQCLSSRHVDRSADIWSIGVVLYELLTGRLPFLGETAAQVRAHVMMSVPPPMVHAGVDIPAQLEALVMRCLEKVPEKRFKGLAVLAASLAPFGSMRARESAARILSSAPSQSPPPLPSSVPAPAPFVHRSMPQVDVSDVHHTPIGKKKARRVTHRIASSYAQPSVLVGIGVSFFAIGLAIGVAVSVWWYAQDEPTRPTATDACLLLPPKG